MNLQNFSVAEAIKLTLKNNILKNLTFRKCELAINEIVKKEKFKKLDFF